MRRRGEPLTDEERMEQHYERFGNTDIPPRGTGLEGIGRYNQFGPDVSISGNNAPGNIGFDWSVTNINIWALVIGGVAVFFAFRSLYRETKKRD